MGDGKRRSVGFVCPTGFEMLEVGIVGEARGLILRG